MDLTLGLFTENHSIGIFPPKNDILSTKHYDAEMHVTYLILEHYHAFNFIQPHFIITMQSS